MLFLFLAAAMDFTFSQKDSIHRGGETNVETHLFLFA